MAENEKTVPKKSKNKITIKQRVILLVSCPLIIILISSIAIVITVRGLEASGELEETTVAPDVTVELPEQFGTAPETYFEEMIKTAAKKTDVNVSTELGVSIHDMSGTFSDDVFTLINNVTGQISGSASSKHNSAEEKFAVNYGDPAEKLLDLAVLSSDIAESSGEGKNNNYSYTVTLPANPETASLFTDEDKKVYEDCKAECAGSVALTDDKFEIESVTVHYNCDVEENRVTSVEIVREYKVSAKAEFLGGLSVFGSGELNFGCRINTKYNIKYAGITIQDELTLTKNGFQTLSMSANVADDALSDEDAKSEGVTDPKRIFTVQFTSSDETIAKVDRTGMVEAVSVSDTPVTITATLSYLGNTYTDTCTVTVTEEE